MRASYTQGYTWRNRRSADAVQRAAGESHDAKMPEGSFAKKLFSLYLTYLLVEKFKYSMKMNCDDRGRFTELVHTEDCGQVSINISKHGITKGQHWHNSKWG